jgi:hypothetical protein
MSRTFHGRKHSTAGASWGPSKSGGWRGREQPAPRICQYFLRGRCTYGKGCKFTHDESQIGRAPTEQERRDDGARLQYNTWKRIIKRDPRFQESTSQQLLWHGALEILDGNDRNSKQSLVQDLESEEYHGRQYILQAMEMTKQTTQNIEVYLEIVGLFLQVMTHRDLIKPLSIDTYVGNLYSFIAGTNGTRAVPFFRRIADSLLNLIATGDTLTFQSHEAQRCLDYLGSAIHEVLTRERRARFNDEIPGLLDALGALSNHMNAASHSSTYDAFQQQREHIRRLVDGANGLLQTPTIGNGNQPDRRVVSTYPHDIVVPGGRHDNDHDDISKIKIFPTDPEIQFEGAEFLPSCDPDMPHFLENKAERHIDTQFRLLRHDIFGQLKSALDGIIKSVSERSGFAKSKYNFDNVRVFPHAGAHVTSLEFDMRKGLLANIAFDQPRQLDGKSSADRRKYWEASRRFDEGELLCLLSTVEQQTILSFVTLVGKSTDPKLDSSLISSARHAVVTTKLCEWNSTECQKLMLLINPTARGVLLELPGVIPGTFVPILKTLQDMHKERRFLFSQYILPDPTTVLGQQLEIRPPVYARHNGFKYNLKPILNDPSQDYFVGVGERKHQPIVIDELESKTSLDKGQAEALISALSREFSLIQGPPGTGKSYLGVQLMRVLLESKARASLGPILVM